MPTISQFSPVLNLGVASANNVKTSAVANPQNATSVRITNNKIAAGSGISFPKVNGSGENGITVGGKSGEYSSGCIIQGNSIFSDSYPYTNGIEIGSNIKNIIVAENDICGFSLNGVLLNQADGYVGSVVNNFIKRKDGQEIRSFISGIRENNCTALVTNNYFSHDTVDGANINDTIFTDGNLANTEAWMKNWITYHNINQYKTIKIHCGQGNFFNESASIHNGKDYDLFCTSDKIVVSQPSYTGKDGDTEEMVRISILSNQPNSGLDILYSDESPKLYVDTSNDDVIKKFPNPNNVDGLKNTYFYVLDNASCKISTNFGKCTVSDIRTTYVENALATNPPENHFNNYSNVPTAISEDWLKYPNGVGNNGTPIVGILKDRVDNSGGLRCKIYGSNKGYDGIYDIISVDSNGIVFDYTKKLDPPIIKTQTSIGYVRWVVQVSDIVGDNIYIKSVNVAANPATPDDISVKIKILEIDANETISIQNQVTTIPVTTNKRIRSQYPIENIIRIELKSNGDYYLCPLTMIYKW